MHRSVSPVEVYLDNNATTRVLPQAAQAAQSAMEILYGNPSSTHVTGLRARHILELTRRRAATVLGAERGRIVFTSGATEAIQMAILSALRAVSERRGGKSESGRVLLYAATEHKAVPEALAHWNELLGVADEVKSIPVDRTGALDLDFLREHAPRADMICTMAVNNETGVITDLKAIERVIRAANPDAFWFADCVQAVGKQNLELGRTTIDFAAASGHKLYAPKGIGLLYVREGVPVTPLITGGGQESGARSGTENLPGVAALGAIFGCLLNKQDETFQSTETLYGYRDRLLASLRVAFPSLVVNTPLDSSVPTTINFSVDGISSKELLDLFDASGIRVSSGSACGSAVQGSYVLEAMGLEQWRCDGAIRMSFGPATKPEEIDDACRIIEAAGEALRGSCILVTDDLDPGHGPRQHGLFQLKRGSNCTWIYVNPVNRRCVVIDPIAEVAERVENFVRCQACEVAAVIDTHAHNDRPSCRIELIELLGDRARHAVTSDFLGWPTQGVTKVQLADGTTADAIDLGDGEVLARTEMPGHTEEGLCFLVGPAEDGKLGADAVTYAFPGDTVLIGGLGRTDFKLSVGSLMYDSLHRLNGLIADDTPICPTHDYHNGFVTTLAAEKQGDGVLARVLRKIAPMSREEFVAEMTQMDSQIESPDTELICGLIRVDDQISSMHVDPEELPAFFRQHRDSIVVDVREAHEFRMFQDWAALGFENPPKSVPLTKLTDFIGHVLRERRAGADEEIIFICRSGNRSARAGTVLRRLGVESSWHIQGGIAICTTGLPSRDPSVAQSA